MYSLELRILKKIDEICIKIIDGVINPDSIDLQKYLESIGLEIDQHGIEENILNFLQSASEILKFKMKNLIVIVSYTLPIFS